MARTILIICSLPLLLTACGRGGASAQKEMSRQKYKLETPAVETVELRRTVFDKEFVCNGRIEVKRKSAIGFKVAGVIEKINVANGDRVKRGDTLALLDRSDIAGSLSIARNNKEKAEIELRNMLIGYGYSSGDTTNVDQNHLAHAKISSGYNAAVIGLREAEKIYGSYVLTAPFSGKIANLAGREYERSGSEFCTLIDDSRLHIDFRVLETELPFIKLGQATRITSFFDLGNHITGAITSINPSVDNSGQILITAEAANNGTFIDGMNVRVNIKSRVAGQLVVPKSAVVLRDNREVLFKYQNGQARWIYVTPLLENSTSYAIEANTPWEDELQEGDVIITSGNINLADGSSVDIINR